MFISLYFCAVKTTKHVHRNIKHKSTSLCLGEVFYWKTRSQATILLVDEKLSKDFLTETSGWGTLFHKQTIHFFVEERLYCITPFLYVFFVWVEFTVQTTNYHYHYTHNTTTTYYTVTTTINDIQWYIKNDGR